MADEAAGAGDEGWSQRLQAARCAAALRWAALCASNATCLHRRPVQVWLHTHVSWVCVLAAEGARQACVVQLNDGSGGPRRRQCVLRPLPAGLPTRRGVLSACRKSRTLSLHPPRTPGCRQTCWAARPRRSHSRAPLSTPATAQTPPEQPAAVARPSAGHQALAAAAAAAAPWHRPRPLCTHAHSRAAWAS